MGYLDGIGLRYFMGLIKTALGLKQDTLVSGTNIKTVNNQSLLGSGNLDISVSGTVTGVKGDSESTYRTGNVNLTAANIGAAASSHGHSAGDITSGTLDAARIPSLPISKITNLQTTLDGKQAAGDYWGASKGSTNYWGLVNPDGASTGWVRTPASGLLPAASGGGSSSLGTSGWPFTNLYATNIYHNGTKLGSAATHDDSDYADATHYHTGVRSSASENALHRMYLTTAKNIRIDERESASGSFALFGYAAVTSQAPSDSGYKTANRVLATPNGSAGLPTMRALVVADLPTGTTASTVALGNHSHSEYFSSTVNRAANTVLAAPNGSTGYASFRALVAADIPQLDANKINLNGYSWLSGATPTYIGMSGTAYTSISTSGWTYYKFLANGGSMYVYHAFGVVKFKNIAITTAHGSGYINSANLYIRLPIKARVIKSATFGTTMGGGLLGVTLLAAGGTGDWKSTTDSLINLPVRLFSPASQAATNSNNDNQFIPVDIWFTAAS